MFSNNFSFNEGIDVELPLAKISLKNSHNHFIILSVYVVKRAVLNKLSSWIHSYLTQFSVLEEKACGSSPGLHVRAAKIPKCFRPHLDGKFV